MCCTDWWTALVLRMSISGIKNQLLVKTIWLSSLPLIARSCKLASVILPLDSKRNFLCPFHFCFKPRATLTSSSPSMLSSMMTSAPASIASSASASEVTSTSRRRLKPPTWRACWMAAVIEPINVDELLGLWTRRNYQTGWPDMVIFQHDHAWEIITMTVDPSNQHAILFNQSKSCQLVLRWKIFKRLHENIPGVVFRVPAIVPLNP